MTLKGMIRFAVMVDNTIIASSICLTRIDTDAYLRSIKHSFLGQPQNVRVVRLHIFETVSRSKRKKDAIRKRRQAKRRETPEMKDCTG